MNLTRKHHKNGHAEKLLAGGVENKNLQDYKDTSLIFRSLLKTLSYIVSNVKEPEPGA